MNMSQTNLKINPINSSIEGNNKSQNISEELTTNNSSPSYSQNQENSSVGEHISIDYNQSEDENELNNKKLVTLKNTPEVKTVTTDLKIEQKAPEKPLIMMEEKEEIFTNYDSDFKKNEKTIMQRMRDLKMIPKTRTGFLLLFVWLALFIISLFFIFDPKHHSIDIYKANLMAILWDKKEEVLTSSGSNLTSTWDINQEIWTWSNFNSWEINSWSLSENQDFMSWSQASSWELVNWEEILIQERWISVNPKLVKFQWWIIKYRYEWKFYSEEELREELRKDLEKEIEKRTKEHLYEIYNNDNQTLDLTWTWEIEEFQDLEVWESFENTDSWALISTWFVENNSSNDDLYNEVINSPIYNTTF